MSRNPHKMLRGCGSATGCGCSECGHHPQPFSELRSASPGLSVHWFDHSHTRAEASLPFPAVLQREPWTSVHLYPPFASETLLSYFITRSNKDLQRYCHIPHKRSCVHFLGLQHQINNSSQLLRFGHFTCQRLFSDVRNMLMGRR